MAAKPLVIALEEHYLDNEVKAKFSPADARAGSPPETAKRLADLGALRLKEMDEVGIDIQVVSHGAPSVQKMDPESCSRRAAPTRTGFTLSPSVRRPTRRPRPTSSNARSPNTVPRAR
jgi:hypothetical protein